MREPWEEKKTGDGSGLRGSLIPRNMRQAALFSLLLGTVVFAQADVAGWKFSTLDEESQSRLESGEFLIMPNRPDELGAADNRFVTIAQLVTGSRTEIWNVIHDKEGAEVFLDGVLESEVIEEGENLIVVSQKTRVGGPKGAYRYTLRHTLTPMERSDFKFVKGEIRNVIGTWWIMEGPDADRKLLVYSLHIDPGVYAPQFVVKKGMKKTMPSTIRGIQDEVTRRSAVLAATKE